MAQTTISLIHTLARDVPLRGKPDFWNFMIGAMSNYLTDEEATACVESAKECLARYYPELSDPSGKV